MYNRMVILDSLREILKAMERIPERFESISAPTDFRADKKGLEHLDSICMVLLAVGEAFKQIDQKTEGKFLSLYPQVPWREVMGVRNVLAHGYFDLDADQIYAICKDDLPDLRAAVRAMITDLESSQST
jgi:uncharacterized protein with HEPN domain